MVASCAPSVALASFPDLSRSLALNNVHTGENLETCYFDGQHYVSQELVRIDKICRDFRRNEIHKMDKKLFDQISLIQAELASKLRYRSSQVTVHQRPTKRCVLTQAVWRKKAIT
ncbi:exported protein [Vibrio ponticus]|nr:exported protein [Vibrio ponticus]